jgi:glycosyltransferase involved in cell wall biosynthesis
VVVLAVGKLTELKHPEALLHVAAGSGPAAPIHVVFAGSGPREPWLKTECQRRGLTNVSFLGFVNQSGLPEVYAVADIFVLASEGETWGLVVNEAMAAGLPVVVSDNVGAVADLVTPGETGYVFRSGDWGELRAHVARLAADPVLRRAQGEAARERSRRYTYDAAARGVVEALSALGLYRSPGDLPDVGGATGRPLISSAGDVRY